ncbi:glycosyltransferase family 4 protein [Mucilaginibacter sp. KACC 22063]|uniref:glycosyltransferase family 4 protein n=1 Tax=Mucilaginibacter sp. KACC 22063 TaxID=3025666 RepID=UPI0023671CBF|nr:glycosyltransferase family 4 protein [Mucilaginibacter sp. KACC 22063]WDF57140.1 glycosyltransferase family 4 protein [Mucilaginibacter sp. KACC 22063]
MLQKKLKVFIVVNVDWFFLSHRLPIALGAKEQGHDVTIIALDTGKGEEIKKHGLGFINAPISRSGTNAKGEAKLLFFLFKLYSRHKPDIIHHITLKPIIYGSLAARIAGIKNVVNAVSGLGYTFTNDRKGIVKPILDLMLKVSLKNKNLHFIFQNNDDLNVFKSKNILKDPGHIHIIKGSGVDLKQFNYSPESTNSPIIVLFLARMLYDKGLVEFIEAAKLLKDKYAVYTRFILAGEIDHDNPAGISEAALMDMLDHDYIHWVGFTNDVKSLIKASNIVVLPSYREGLPKSLIEACAIGRPIVTTDAPGCRECVIDKYNGYLVPVKDSVVLAEKIEMLIRSKDLRLMMGKNSRSYAEENFSIHKVVNDTINIYHEMAGLQKVKPPVESAADIDGAIKKPLIIKQDTNVSLKRQ